MLAGHDTTANTVSWTLLELAQHPEMQQRLRQEIWDKQLALGREFEYRDLETMPYLQAVVKVLLHRRFSDLLTKLTIH